MDTLGPRIMVNVGTQAAATTALNPRDLAPLTNDAFLATFLGKTSLSANSAISRQNNNYRQSNTSQMDRVTLRSKPRTPASNGDSIEPDSAILSIIRGNHADSQTQPTTQRSSQGSRNRRRSFNQQLLSGLNDIPCSPNYRPADANRRRRTRSGGAQQQITVVDQMAAQPHIPYAILPKRFEPKQVPGSATQHSSRVPNNAPMNNANHRNNRRRQRRSANPPTGPRRGPRSHDYYDDQWEDEEEDLWLEPLPPMMYRRFGRRAAPRNFPPMNGYYGPRSMQRLDEYYGPYGYGPMARPNHGQLRSRRRVIYDENGHLPLDIVPSYDLNEWQGPYARSKKLGQQRNGYRAGRDDNGFIRDDHRLNGPSRQSRYGQKSGTPTRNGKQTKSPKTKGSHPPKRRNSRSHKTRNQNSKTEALGTPSTATNEAKSSTTETETVDAEKQKTELKLSTEETLSAHDESNKENHEEKKSE